MRLTSIGLLCVVALILGSYWWKGLGIKDLDDAAYSDLRRRGLVSELTTLSNGAVNFRLEGPPDGEPVLLIHGFAVPMFVWDQVAKDLIAAGYRVLAFDNYGRGFSSRPDVVYDENLSDTLIVELLDRLAIRRKIHVVGYSAGGVSAAVFVARHPNSVKTLSLIAPGGLLTSAPFPAWPFAIPGIKRWFGRVVAPSLISGQIAKTFVGLPDADRSTWLVRQQFAYAGAGEAMASLLQNFPLSGADEYYRLAGTRRIPTLLLWGTADTTAPFGLSSAARHYLPEAEIVTFENGEHNIVYERPQTISRELECQSACKFDPSSASNFDPFARRGLAVALVSSELAGIAEARRARVA